MAEWSCVACTYLNPAGRNQCEICCTSKPGATIQTRSERDTLWNQQIVTMPPKAAASVKADPKAAAPKPQRLSSQGAKNWNVDTSATSAVGFKTVTPRTLRAPPVASIQEMDAWRDETPWEALVAQIQADFDAKNRPNWYKLSLALVGAADRTKAEGEMPEAVAAFVDGKNGFAKTLEHLLDAADHDFSLARAWTDLVRAWDAADEDASKKDTADEEETTSAESATTQSAGAGTAAAAVTGPPPVSKLVDADQAADEAERAAKRGNVVDEKGATPPAGDGPIASRMKASFEDAVRAAAIVLSRLVRRGDLSKLGLLEVLLNPRTRRYQYFTFVSASSSPRNKPAAGAAAGATAYTSYASAKTNVGAPHLHVCAHETFAAHNGYAALVDLVAKVATGPTNASLSALAQIFAKNAEAVSAEAEGRELMARLARSVCAQQLDWPLTALLDGASQQQKLIDSLGQVADASGDAAVGRLVIETALAQHMRFVQSDKLRFRRFGIEQLGKLSSALTTSQKMSIKDLTALYKSRAVYEEVFGDRMDERVVSCSELLLKNSALDVEILDLLLANTNSRAVRKMLTAIVLQSTFTEELAQHMLLEASRAIVYHADYGAYKLIIAILASEAYTRETLIRKGPLAMGASLGALWTLLFCISVQAPAHTVASAAVATPPRTESPARDPLSRKRPTPPRLGNAGLQQQQPIQPMQDLDQGDAAPILAQPMAGDGIQDADPATHTIIGALGLSPERMEELMLAFNRVAKECSGALRLRFAERALDLIKRTHVASENASAGLAGLAGVEVQDSLSMGFFAADDDDDALAAPSTDKSAMRSEETLVEAEGLLVTATTPETAVVAYKVFRGLILATEQAERPAIISELDDAWNLKNLLLGEFDAFMRLSPVRARLDKIEASIESQAANAVSSAAAAAAFDGTISQLTAEESRFAEELQQHEKARLKTLSALVKNSSGRLHLTAEDMERLWTSCCMPCYDINQGNYTTQETFMLWLRVSCFDDKWSCVEPEVCRFVLSELFQNRLDLVRVGPKTYHCLQAHFTFVNAHDKLLEAVDNEAVAEVYKFKSRGPPKGLEGSNLVDRRISVLLKTGRMAPGKITKYISWSNLHKIEYVNGFSEEKDLARLDSWFLLPPIDRAMAGRVDFKEVNVLDLAGRETIWAVALHGELPVVAVQAFNLLLGLYERIRLAMLHSGDSEDGGGSSEDGGRMPSVPEVDLFVEHIFDELESYLGTVSVRGDGNSIPASTTSSPSSVHQHQHMYAGGPVGGGPAGGTLHPGAPPGPPLLGAAGGVNGSGSGHSGSESQFGIESEFFDGSFLPRCIQFLHLYVKQLDSRLDDSLASPRKLAGLGMGDPLTLLIKSPSEALTSYFGTTGLQTHTRVSVADVLQDLIEIADCPPGRMTLRICASERRQLSSAPHDLSFSLETCGNLLLEDLGLAGVGQVQVEAQIMTPAPVVKQGIKPTVVARPPVRAPNGAVKQPTDKMQDAETPVVGDATSETSSAAPNAKAVENEAKKAAARSLRSKRCVGFEDLCQCNFTSTPGGLVSCQSERVEILLKLLDHAEKEERLEVLELLMSVPPFLREMQLLLVPEGKSASDACAELLASFREMDLWRAAYLLKLLGDLVLFPEAVAGSSTASSTLMNGDAPPKGGDGEVDQGVETRASELCVGGMEIGRPLTAEEFFTHTESLQSVMRLFLSLVRQCGVPGMHRRVKSAAVGATKSGTTTTGGGLGLSESARLRPSLSMNEATFLGPSALFAALPMMARTVRLTVEALIDKENAPDAESLMDETAEALLRVILVTRDELEKRKSGRGTHSCNCFGDFLGVPLDTHAPTGDAHVDAETMRMRSTEPPPLDQTLLGLRAPVCAFCLNTRRLVRAVLHLLAALEDIVVEHEAISQRFLSRGSTCATIVQQLVLHCGVSEVRLEVCAMLKRIAAKIPQLRKNLGVAIRDAERELENERVSQACDDFFDLLQSFVPDTSQGGNITAEDHELVHRMVALILEWPSRPPLEQEGMEAAETNLFVGFLQALARILETHSTLRQQAARTRLSRAKYGDDNLVRVLWNRFVVGESNARPVCETSESRQALTKLLCTLTCDDIAQAKALAGLIEGFSGMTPTPLCQTQRGRVLVPDWEFEPLPQGIYSSEFRGRNSTGHMGLRNRGSTCYMNSLLQLLFHVPRFRRCILSAPVTPPHSLVSGTHHGGSSGSESGSVGNSSASRKTPDLEENRMVVGWLCRCSGINDLNAPTCHICSSTKAADAEMVTESFRPGGPGSSTNGSTGSGEAPGGGAGGTDDGQYNLEVLRQLQRTFRFMQDCNKGCFDPMNLVESCAALKLQFPVTSQNDTSEFYDKLLDNLETCLDSTPFLDEMKDCFLGQQTKLKRCHTCGRVSTSREESFYRLELMTKDNSVEKNTLQECLESFVAPEVMTGDNKVDCDQCQARMPCTFVSCMTDLPDYLFIHPKRFTFDLYTMQTVKLNHRITFPTHLDMFPYTRDGRAVEAERQARLVSTSGGAAAGASGDASAPAKARFEASSFWTNGSMTEGEVEDARMKCQYVLSGVLVHNGRAGGGHYYSFKHVSPDSIAERLDEGHMDGASLFTNPKQGWFRFDDDRVLPFDPASTHAGLDAECFGGSTEKTSKTSWGTLRTEKVEREFSAFMLLYERVEEAADSASKAGGAASASGSELPFSPLPRRGSLLSSTPHSPVLSSLLTASRSVRRRGGRRLKRHKSSEADRRRFALAVSASPHAAAADGKGGSSGSSSVMRRVALGGSQSRAPRAAAVPQSLKESTLSGLIVKHRDWVSKRFYALLNEEVRISNAAYAKQAVLFDHLVVSMALQQLLVAQDKNVQDPDLGSVAFTPSAHDDVLAASLEEETVAGGEGGANGSGRDLDNSEALEVPTQQQRQQQLATDMREAICESCLRIFAHLVLRIKHNGGACLGQWVGALESALDEYPRLARVILLEVAHEKPFNINGSPRRVKEMELAIHQLSRLQQYSAALQQVGNPLLSTRGFRSQFLDCPHPPAFAASLRLLKRAVRLVADAVATPPDAAQRPSSPVQDREVLKDLMERMLEEISHASKHALRLERYGKVWAELAALEHAEILRAGTELDVVAFLAHLLLGIRSPAEKYTGRSDLPAVGVPEGSAMPNIVPLMRSIRFFARAPMLSDLACFIVGSQAFIDSVFALYTSGEAGMRDMIEDFVRRDLFRTTPVLAKGITEVRENAGFCQYASTTSSGERPTKAHQSFQLLCTIGAMTVAADIQDAIANELCGAMRRELEKSLPDAPSEMERIRQHAKSVAAGRGTFGVSQFLVFMLATLRSLTEAHESLAPRWAAANYDVWRSYLLWLELVSPPHNKSFVQGFSDGFVETLLNDLCEIRRVHLPGAESEAEAALADEVDDDEAAAAAQGQGQGSGQESKAAASE